MANNIKGITIQIGGDTTGLDKALKGVNGQAREAQNELKEVNKALKLDPTNVELLEQKQRALASAVEATTQKLETLKDAQKQAAAQLASGDIGQQQYDALSREIVKTEAELRKAKDAQDDFNISAEQASAKLSAVGEKAQIVADKTKDLSLAAGGLVAAIGGVALKSAEWADDLNTLSKQTGITTDDLQKMQFASGEIDVSMDDITTAITRLKQSMASDAKADVFSRLGISVRDTTGAMRDSTTVFYELVDRLSKVGNETERDQLAMELLGRNAGDLAGIIDDGGEAFRSLGEEAENLGLILDQETLDSMNKVNDQIDRLKATAKADFMKAGASALEALGPLIEDIAKALSTLLGWIGQINPKVIEVVVPLAAIVASISPIAGLIAKIAGVLGSLAPLLPMIGTALAAIASPVGLIVIGIGALILILAELVKTIHDNWDKIKQKLTDAKDYVVGIFEKIRDAVKEKINAVIDFVNKGIEAINKLIAKINDSALGKFFGINIRSIGTLPALAGGGSLASGSALVGENGPELLSMSNGRANVQPLQTTTNTYNTINQTSRQPVQVILDVNGMQLARALYDPLKQVSAQRGPSFVK